MLIELQRPDPVPRRAALPTEPGPRARNGPGSDARADRVHAPRGGAPDAGALPGLPVSLRGVEMAYDGRAVLRGIDLDVAPGSFVAIVGRSGCGKSTLLRLVAGLERARGGTLSVGDGAPTAARDDVRMMFQDARLLPWKTVLDNVSLGLRGPHARPRALRALARVGLAERAGDWPAVLSGGQRQRVALARALVHAPRLLLLDEPLGALDALTRIEMQRLIEELWRERGMTALLVTHDVSEAVALADRILLLEDGRVAMDLAQSMARPRARGDAAFAAIEDRVLRRVLAPPSEASSEIA